MACRSFAVALSVAILSAPAGVAIQNANQVGMPAAAKQKSYCIELEGGTGSRVRKVECKTKAEWARLGVDVDQLTKN